MDRVDPPRALVVKPRSVNAVLVALALTAPVCAAAQVDPGAARLSYWGPFPALSDSVTGTFDNTPMPLWESLVVWPYRVVSIPFTLFRIGVGAGVTAADEGHLPDRIAHLLRTPTGPVGVLVHVSGGGLPGVGGGITFRHDDFPSAGQRVRASVTSSFRRDHRVRLGFEFPVDGSGAALQLGAGYRVRPNARFFGFGPHAAAANESYYQQRLTWLGTSLRWPLGSSWVVEGQGLWTEVGAIATDAESPPLADRFVGALPPGYGQYASGLSASLTFVNDDTRGTGRPGRGGIRRLRAVVFRGNQPPHVAFATYRVELQQFVRVGYLHHVVAVRALGSWVASLDDRPVPFQYLLTNDDPDLMRGYQDFRWRDRGLALLSAEYRWPLWALTDAEGLGLDIYLLSDVGQVFGSASQLALDNLTMSYGVGVRLLSRRGFTARVEYARSAEQWLVRLRADQIFQFSHNALFYGRDPVPFR